MATNFDDLTQEQQAQVRARFTLGDPRAYVYGLGLGGDVLTRTPAPAEQPDLDESAMFARWRAKLRQLPASDRAQIENLIDRFLQDVRAEAAGNSDQATRRAS
jgi:hypothetical protein